MHNQSSIAEMREFPFTKFSQINRLRCESPNGFNHLLVDWPMTDWTNAVAGEAGEACNVSKKLKRIQQGIPGNKQDETPGVLLDRLAKELADVIIYADLAIQALGYNTWNIVRDTFDAKSEQIGSVIKMTD